MSDITLADLHAKMAAASRALCERETPDDPTWEWMIETDRLLAISKRAMSVYRVAEAHGLEAAMIYKITDGNIDPRKT